LAAGCPNIRHILIFVQREGPEKGSFENLSRDLDKTTKSTGREHPRTVK
jgi:hypothetical protein